MISKQVENTQKLIPSSIFQDEEHGMCTLHFELAKIIKRYEQCSGWTMLIAPENLPNKRQMNLHKVNLNKVLTIPKKSCSHVLATAYQALKIDNCSALVIWDDCLSAVEIKLLLQKARKNNTSLYFLKNNNEYSSLTSH
jgi:cell division inhibitor SulA